MTNSCALLLALNPLQGSESSHLSSAKQLLEWIDQVEHDSRNDREGKE